MRFLVTFFQQNLHFLLFIALEAVSGVMLFRFNTHQGGVALMHVQGVAAQVGKVWSEADAFVHLGEANEMLTRQNINLQRQNNALREAIATLTRDTTQTERLMLEHLTDFRLLPAQVVSHSKERAGQYLLIDKGQADGVQTEMGVVCSGGVVGIVYLTSEHHSLVLPVTNKRSAISVRLRGERFFGYLTWQGGSRLHASLDDIPLHAKVKKGDVVETSGYSSVFPPGIFAGRVNGWATSGDGQSYRLDVRLGTDFDLLRDVAVVMTPYRAELDTLRSHLEDVRE